MKGKLTPEQKELMKIARENRVPKEEKIYVVNKDFRIVSDGIQYILQKLNKKENWVLVGYHSHISSVINSLAEHEVKDNLDALLFVSRQLEEIKAIVSDYENLNKLKP